MRRPGSSSCRSTRCSSCSRSRLERARARRDAAADPRPARVLADRGAPRRGDEREHDAAARRADRRLGAGPRSSASGPRARSSRRSSRRAPTLGGLLPHVAEATGLPRTTPVVAVASHDTASAVVAVPVGVGRHRVHLERHVVARRRRAATSRCSPPQARARTSRTSAASAARRACCKNVMGLWLVQECRRAWLREGARGLRGARELAAAAPGGALFDPDLPELLAPGDMPAGSRALCGTTPTPDAPARDLREPRLQVPARARRARSASPIARSTPCT